MSNRSPLTTSISLTIMCILSFGLVLLFGAFLLQIGIRSNYIGVLLFAFLVGIYLFAGLFGKTMRLSSYQTADRSASPFHSGQSIAAGLVSSGIFIFLAGEIYEFGSLAISAFLGWVLGSCLMVVLIASSVNRKNKPTLTALIQPEAGSRYLLGLVMAIIISVAAPFLLLQFSMAGYIGELFFGLSDNDSIIIMSISIGVCLILGGIQALALARTLAYPIIAIAFLVPLMTISQKLTGNPFPQFAYGSGALQPILEIDKQLADSGFRVIDEAFSLTQLKNVDYIVYFSTLICLACGTTAMPHLLQHFTTQRSGHEAQRAGAWGIFFMLIIITAVPAYAIFYRFDVYTALLGLQIGEIDANASWLYQVSGRSAFNAIAICGEFVANAKDILNACGEGPEYFLTAEDITANPLLLVLSSGILNDLFSITTWVLVIGALIAIWSTADGVILAIANTLSHDGYANLIRPHAPQSIRLFMNRFMLVVTLAVFTIVAILTDFPAKQLFEASFALSAGAVFLPLITRIWWPHASDNMIVLGMVTGFIITIALIFLAVFGSDLQIASGDELILSLTPNDFLLSLMPAGLLGLIGSAISMTLVYFLERSTFTKHKKAKDLEHVPSDPETV